MLGHSLTIGPFRFAQAFATPCRASPQWTSAEMTAWRATCIGPVPASIKTWLHPSPRAILACCSVCSLPGPVQGVPWRGFRAHRSAHGGPSTPACVSRPCLAAPGFRSRRPMVFRSLPTRRTACQSRNWKGPRRSSLSTSMIRFRWARGCRETTHCHHALISERPTGPKHPQGQFSIWLTASVLPGGRVGVHDPADRA